MARSGDSKIKPTLLVTSPSVNSVKRQLGSTKVELFPFTLRPPYFPSNIPNCLTYMSLLRPILATLPLRIIMTILYCFKTNIGVWSGRLLSMEGVINTFILLGGAFVRQFARLLRQRFFTRFVKRWRSGLTNWPTKANITIWMSWWLLLSIANYSIYDKGFCVRCRLRQYAMAMIWIWNVCTAYWRASNMIEPLSMSVSSHVKALYHDSVSSWFAAKGLLILMTSSSVAMSLPPRQMFTQRA